MDYFYFMFTSSLFFAFRPHVRLIRAARRMKEGKKNGRQTSQFIDFSILSPLLRCWEKTSDDYSCSSPVLSWCEFRRLKPGGFYPRQFFQRSSSCNTAPLCTVELKVGLNFITGSCSLNFSTFKRMDFKYNFCVFYLSFVSRMENIKGQLETNSLYVRFIKVFVCQIYKSLEKWIISGFKLYYVSKSKHFCFSPMQELEHKSFKISCFHGTIFQVCRKAGKVYQ